MDPTEAQNLALHSRPSTMCTAHPGVPSVHTCSRCAIALCAACVVKQPDGTALCPTCAVRHSATLQPKTDPRVQPGQMCLRHADVPAVHLCQLCGSPFCITCDFEFAGNVHVCPDCAILGKRPLSSRRFGMALGALAAAASVTLGPVFLVLAARTGTLGRADLRSLVRLYDLLVPFAVVTGTALGFGTLNRRLGNPPLLLILAVWNLVLLGVYLFGLVPVVLSH